MNLRWVDLVITNWKRTLSPQIIFQPKSGSSSKRSDAQWANRLRCLSSLPLNSSVKWILYWWKSKSRRKIYQVWEKLAASYSPVNFADSVLGRCSPNVRVFGLVVYRTNRTEFGHQILESRLWRATACVKWAYGAQRNEHSFWYVCVYVCFASLGPGKLAMQGLSQRLALRCLPTRTNGLWC